MSKLDIIRAWKDEEYRNGLSAEALAQIPENPAGTIELRDAELLEVAGGTGREAGTAGCCVATYDTWTCAICSGLFDPFSGYTALICCTF